MFLIKTIKTSKLKCSGFFCFGISSFVMIDFIGLGYKQGGIRIMFDRDCICMNTK